MDKIANYKEQIYKEAGVMGGAFAGTIGGAFLGAELGNLAGKFIPRSKEMKSLHAEREILKNKHDNLQDKYDNAAEFDTQKFDKYLHSLPNYNKLTVGEVENIGQDYFNRQFRDNISKTASLKSTGIAAAVTAIPTAALTAKYSFDNAKKDKRDKEYVKNQMNEYKNGINYYKNKLSGNERLNLKKYLASTDHNGNYSPSLIFPDSYDVACEGKSFYGDAVNKILKKYHNIDYKKMNYNKYHNLVAGAAPILGEDGDWYNDKYQSPSRDYIAAHVKKKASELVDELFEKEAKYLKKIKCEQCGYEGYPSDDDGKCPKCGAFEGVMPHELDARDDGNSYNLYSDVVVDSVADHSLGTADVIDEIFY